MDADFKQLETIVSGFYHPSPVRDALYLDDKHST